MSTMGTPVVRRTRGVAAAVASALAAVVASALAVPLATPVAPVLGAQGAVLASPSAAPPRSAAATDTLTEQFDVAGIPVVLRRVTANSVVAANVYLLGGVRQLTPATQGIELLLLEAAEAGTVRYPRDEGRARLARLGSAIAVSASTDWSVLGLRSTVVTFDSTWMLMADRLVQPRLDDEEVVRVRERIRAAVRQRDESPDAQLAWLADSTAFAGHPYGLSAIGTDASLGALDAAALRAYHAAQVVRSRLLVVVVGNVTRERVTRLVSETLAALPAGGYAWTLPEPPARFLSTVTAANRRLPTNYLQGWFLGPRADDPDYVALRLACAVLSGRLFTEVRERRNLTYAVDAPFEERAIASGGLYVTTVAPAAVAQIMRDEMRALQRGTIGRDGLERLVQQFIVSYYLDNETNADQADLLARAVLYRGDWRAANRFVEELRAVTPEDIRRAAVRWFGNVRWAYVGDPFRLDRRLLESF